MLHCTSHRQLFNKRYRFLNYVIPWWAGPFFGQTPETYFAHHIGMHHAEENLQDDLSSTMGFRRDRFLDWLKYCGRFLLLRLPDLSRYMAAHKRTRLLRRVLIGEGLYYCLLVLLAILNPWATFVSHFSQLPPSDMAYVVSHARDMLPTVERPAAFVPAMAAR